MPLIILFEFATLKTTLTEAGIVMRFFPFSNKTYDWREIESAELVNYGFVGGWGVRYGTQFGTVYTVRGSDGLSLKLRDGTSVVIGTQVAEHLSKALEQVRP